MTPRAHLTAHARDGGPDERSEFGTLPRDRRGETPAGGGTVGAQRRLSRIVQGGERNDGIEGASGWLDPRLLSPEEHWRSAADSGYP